MEGAKTSLVPLILTVAPSGGADPGTLAWRKPTVVKTALPMPIALMIPAAAMMTKVKFVGIV